MPAAESLPQLANLLQTFAEEKLSDAQARILVKFTEGFTVPSRIARELRLSPAAICESCLSLAKRGFLIREKRTGRRARYSISPLGTRIVNRLAEAMIPPAAEDPDPQ